MRAPGESLGYLGAAMDRGTARYMNRGRFRVRRLGGQRPESFAGCLASARLNREEEGGPPGEERLLRQPGGRWGGAGGGQHHGQLRPQAAQRLWGRPWVRTGWVGALGRSCLCEEGLGKSPSWPWETVTLAPWRVSRQIDVCRLWPQQL